MIFLALLKSWWGLILVFVRHCNKNQVFKARIKSKMQTDNLPDKWKYLPTWLCIAIVNFEKKNMLCLVLSACNDFYDHVWTLHWIWPKCNNEHFSLIIPVKNTKKKSFLCMNNDMHWNCQIWKKNMLRLALSSLAIIFQYWMWPKCNREHLFLIKLGFNYKYIYVQVNTSPGRFLPEILYQVITKLSVSRVDLCERILV